MAQMVRCVLLVMRGGIVLLLLLVDQHQVLVRVMVVHELLLQ